MIKTRGLELKFIGGTHSKGKMLRGQQFSRKKLLRAAISKKTPQKKLNLVKSYSFVKIGMLAGRTTVSGGPLV